MDDISRETQKPPVSGRVHILGAGNAGIFMAHALASRQSRPPITLLFERPYFYDIFRRKRSSLAIVYHGLDDIKTGFDAQVMLDGQWYEDLASNHRIDENQTEHPLAPEGNPSDRAEGFADLNLADDEHIECLIVCSKAHLVRKLVSFVKHRLSADSTILLMNPGLGVMENLNRHIFPDPKTRPHYIQGVQTHTIWRNDNFKASYAGVGSTILCPMTDIPQTPMIDADSDTHWAPTTKYLLRLLTLTPSLVATVDTPTGILQYQLERLAIACIIDPLTALTDGRNGELLYVFSATRVMRLLLFEISSVILALPELQGVPGIEHRFAPERLRRLALHVASRYPKKTSKMLEDLQRHRSMDIEFSNGWIVSRGEELGIKCVSNYMIQHLVYAKHLIHSRRTNATIPMDLDLGMMLEHESLEDQPGSSRRP